MADKHRGGSSTAARPRLPEDRFDGLERSGRVGSHRLVARPRRFWVYFLAFLVGVAVLTGAGILLLQTIGTDIPVLREGGGGGEHLVEQVKPEINPEATVAVLNGTQTPGLEAGVAQVIADNGWGQIGFSQVAASNEVQISAVFYVDPADEAAALGLAKELGGVSIYQSEDYAEYGVQLVVLLGADYAGPDGS